MVVTHAHTYTHNTYIHTYPHIYIGSVSVVVTADGVAGVYVAGGGGSASSMLGKLLGNSGKTQLSYGDQPQFSPSLCTEQSHATIRHTVLNTITSEQDTATIEAQWSCLILDGSAGNGSTVSLNVTDTFVPAQQSIVIQTSIRIMGDTIFPFTSTIQNGLFWEPKSDSARVWMPWGKGCTINSGTRSSCRGVPNWENPLIPEPFPTNQSGPNFYRYGALGRNSTDVVSIPIVTAMDIDVDKAVSFALSVADPLLEVGLETFASGLSWRREMLRLGTTQDILFSAHIAGHRADWRPTLRFMLRQFPNYFVSRIDDLEDFEG